MCGVVGIIGTPQAAQECFLGLTTLQHRGQDAAGILTYDSEGFHQVKHLGLVESVFTRENMESLTGSMGVGHARYSTVGRGEVTDVQPFVISFPFGLGLVHNGNTVNSADLAHQLKKQARRHLLTRSDSEIILNLLAQGLAEAGPDLNSEDFFEILCRSTQSVFEQVNGSYSVCVLIAGYGLVAIRDPLGIRPLMWGEKEGDLPSGRAHCFASEAAAATFNGYQAKRSVEPGEVVFVDMQGQVFNKRISKQPIRPCMFEWVYFASPESELDQVGVYSSRIQLGKNLAQLIQEKIKQKAITPEIIIPVPETSRIASIALAEELKLPYREVLIKNRYIKRTFILDSDEKRKAAVSLKLSPVRSEIEGRNVLLIDDSIVRGTTSRKLIELVRKAGAKEVYFVSTCPPIKHPCYYGIDFPNKDELVAYNRNNSEIEKELGADCVIYLDIPGLRKSLMEAGGDHSASVGDPCVACLNGEYPTDVSQAGLQFAATRSSDRQSDKTNSSKSGGSPAS